MADLQPDELAGRLDDGDPRSVARALSLVEQGGRLAGDLLGLLHARTGRALTIGVTGPPGAGKSTLVAGLIDVCRRRDRRVGVLAVDPTSPFTGGALLGDRVRMQTHATDPGVFIRSMATRGRLGGLAPATADAALVLDAAGFDVVLIETVGVGQDEVDVVRVADVSVVVLVPGAGDDVQALKAGLMEIADLFVVNKSDLPGADAVAAAVQAALELAGDRPGSRPPVLRASALTGDGIEEVFDAIQRIASDGEELARRRRARLAWRLRELVVEGLRRTLDRGALAPDAVAALVDRMQAGGAGPHATAAALVHRIVGDDGPVLDHVAIATPDLGATAAWFAEHLDLHADATEEVVDQKVRVAFVRTGSARLELVEPLDAGSPVAAFLDRRGPGLHHVAVRVADLAAVLARLRDEGVRLIDTQPRPGAHGTHVAFVHPSSTGGVLLELVGGGTGANAGR